jgi:RNA polymerase sigma-70 factor (ECF subfamily)
MDADQSFTATSPTLLHRMTSLDTEAWDRFSALYSPLVYRWCRRSGLQDADASDISQEVFRSVARNIEKFRHGDPEHTFRGWLWTITKNKIRDFYRSGAKQPDAFGGSAAYGRMQEVPDLPVDCDEASGFDTTATLAHHALELVQQDFAPHTWQAFLRVTLKNENAADVAEDLGMSVGSVHTARWRVLKRLREETDGLL